MGVRVWLVLFFALAASTVLHANELMIEVSPADVRNGELRVGVENATAATSSESYLIELRFNGIDERFFDGAPQGTHECSDTSKSEAAKKLPADAPKTICLARWLRVTAAFGIARDPQSPDRLSTMKVDISPFSASLGGAPESPFTHVMRIDVLPVRFERDRNLGLTNSYYVSLIRFDQQLTAGPFGNSIISGKLVANAIASMMSFHGVTMQNGFTDRTNIGGIFGGRMGGSIGAELDLFNRAVRINATFIGGESDLSSAGEFWTDVFSRLTMTIKDSLQVSIEKGSRSISFNRFFVGSPAAVDATYDYTRATVTWLF